MTKNSRSLKALFQKTFCGGRAPFFVLFLIASVVFGGSFYFLYAKNTALTPLKQPILVLPSSDEGPDITDEEEDNDNDELQDSNSPWTILKTALPSQFSDPMVKTETPVIAIILTGLGLDREQTTQILTTFKGKATFAFSPYSSNLQGQIQEAANLGNQVLVALPMEPYTFPNPDPGPHTLLTGVKAEENILKTKDILKKIPNGIGMIGNYGARFTLSQADLEPVLKEIKNHGSIFVDPYTTLHSQVQATCKLLGMGCHQVNLTMSLAAKDAQDAFFKKVIQNAKENGIIIVSIPALPAFTDNLLEWIAASEKKGISFVTIAHLKTPKLSTEITVEYQGAENVSKQNPH
jgi:polysaccharide deacetylase 2 family uncharacterized protein YibQ